MVVFGGYSYFFQNRYFVYSWYSWSCIQCTKTLLLSYYKPFLYSEERLLFTLGEILWVLSTRVKMITACKLWGNILGNRLGLCVLCSVLRVVSRLYYSVCNVQCVLWLHIYRYIIHACIWYPQLQDFLQVSSQMRIKFL